MKSIANKKYTPVTVSDLIGKPFLYGGRGPDHYDCYGLVSEIYKRRGIALPPLLSATSYKAIDPIFQNEKKGYIKIDKPEAYAIVSFIIRPPFVSHVGVVLENEKSFIHVLQKRFVAIEQLSSQSWNHRIEGYYRWRE